MAINRVSTFSQQQQNLINLLRNESTLNDVLLQQSTGNKAPTYAGVSPQAGQLLNVDALKQQSQGFIDNINAATTRLNLTDTALKGIGDLATNFQQELQQLQSSPTPPNISDLARTTLQQLGSLLNSADGSQFLFAGSQQSAAPVTSLNTTRIPTKTLSLAGNLDTAGIAPANGNVAPPSAGSYVDVSLAGQNAVFDSNGNQYDTTVRFVHQSTSKWQAYLVSMTRTDDPSQSATFNGQAISANNPVAIGSQFDPSVSPPFNQVGNTAPANALQFDNLGTANVPQIALPSGGGSIAVNIDANSITNTASGSVFTQIDNASPTTRIVVNSLNLDPNTAVGDSVTINLTGANSLFASGAIAGHDKLNATITLHKTQAFNPNNNQPELWEADLTSLTDPNNQTGVGNINVTAGGTGFAVGDTVTFAAPAGGASTVAQVTSVGAGGSITGLQVITAGEGYATGALGAAVATSGAGTFATVTGTATSLGAASVTKQPINSVTPYVIGKNFQPGQFAFGANIKIGLAASGTQDAAGSTFEMLATPGAPNTGTLGTATTLQFRAGTVTTNPIASGTASATSAGTVTVNPNPSNPAATHLQILELSGNLSSATTVNISVATPTAGSFTDISFQNAQALVDSNGDAHNMTLRIIKTVQKGAGAPPAAADLYQAYVIGLTDVESGKDSTNPPITPTSPVALGPTFDPTSPATAIPSGKVTFAPALTNGASMSVDIPITSNTFDIKGANIVLTASENSTAPVSTSAAGTLNMAGNLSSAAASSTNTSLLQSLNITNGGTGFAVGDTITFNTPPGGTAAVATVSSIGAGGVITGLTITNSGTGYTKPPYIVSTSGGGTGQVLQPVTVAALSLQSVGITNGGTGFVVGDTITFNAPAGGTAAQVKVTSVGAGGVITGLTLVSGGSNYTSAPTIASTSGAGTGESLQTVTGQTKGGLGPLSVTAGSTGFAVGDTITFSTPAGGGTAATAVVTSIGAGGAITGLKVTNPGAGYAPGQQAIASTSGAGVIAGVTVSAPLGPSINDLNQPIGALVPAGTVIPIALANQGSGYTAATTKVTFPAPPNGGIQATGTVTIAAGKVTQITITDPGSGYLTPPVPTITDTGAVPGTGAVVPAVTLSDVNASNTADLDYYGVNALRDATGKAFDATVRVQYNTVGGITGWRAYITKLTDPTTGNAVPLAAGTPSPTPIGAPPFDVFHPQDAALGPITIPSNGPQSISLGTVPATSLSLSIPFNTENFSSGSAASQLTVGGQSTASLSANIADTTYFQPGGKVFDTSEAQLQLRTATDSVVKFGVRADNAAFEQLFRVLNFFKDQSVPATPGEVDNASRLVNTAISGINALRADVANTQAVLKNELTFHQQTITLAQTGHDQILTADSATTAMNLNAIANLLQESFATLGTVKSLSLVNFLK